MNNIESLLKQLDEQEAEIHKKRKALQEIQPRLEGFPKNLQLSFGSWPLRIDIDYLGRAETVEFITFFKAGKWDKKLSNAEGKIDYENTTITVLPLRIYGAEPPPSCKIIEEDVLVPEHITPARIIKKKRIECPKGALNT